jgi:dimethylhistidine N-methyltransferase
VVKRIAHYGRWFEMERDFVAELAPETLDDFGRSVVTGLSQPQKSVPARFFYDRRGSELFEAITHLPEYYPTRVETGLLREHAADIVRLAGVSPTVVEFGAGSAAKTPILLKALRPDAYVAVDISGDFLAETATALASAHPDITIIPVSGDFTRPLDLPDLPRPLTGFFPGSTIGNFGHAAAVDLLRSFATTLGPRSHLVIGLDTRKNPRLIEAAYDDAAGVTAAFNLNLLRRINRELDGTIPLDSFEHRAWWHGGRGRIEMHLEATRDLAFRVAGRFFAMRKGETIHTENSHKYSPDEARLIARAAGWEPMAMWTDADGLFSLHVWAHDADRIGP